jgi:aspartokinase
METLVLHIRERVDTLSRKSAVNEGRPVFVATGFFGMVPGGVINHVGRGYSDVCAALCARATDAQELQIWKEVSK